MDCLLPQILPRIVASTFVKRQVKGSGLSYSDYSFEKIAQMTIDAYLQGKIKPGYRDGVILVQLPPKGFYCSIVKLSRFSIISSSYKTRQVNEESRLVSSSFGTTIPAEEVNIVLYSHDVLLEGNENSDLTADYEIVSINVSPKGGIPMNPYTMARNQLVLPGGTAANYSSEKWAEAVYFWHNHVMKMPRNVFFKALLVKILMVLGIVYVIQEVIHF